MYKKIKEKHHPKKKTPKDSEIDDGEILTSVKNKTKKPKAAGFDRVLNGYSCSTITSVQKNCLMLFLINSSIVTDE